MPGQFTMKGMRIPPSLRNRLYPRNPPAELNRVTLCPPSSCGPLAIFSRVIYPAFGDREFEFCYSEIGRPAISPAFLACVTLLQFRENLSDAETSRAVIRRLDWKIALHIPVWEKLSFDPSTLTYFRRRLRESDNMRIIFDRTLELAQSHGLLRKHTPQRIDATHVLSHVNRISTTDLLFRTVRCVVEEIGKKAPQVYRSQLPEYLKDRYGNRFSSFGMSKENRQNRQAEIIEDGLLLKSIVEQQLAEQAQEFRQLMIMDTIFEENVVIKKKADPDKVLFEIEEIHQPKQTIFDPRDTSQKLGRKGKCSWVGSKCHVVETAERGKVNFITNMIYQPANEYDGDVHDQVSLDNERIGLEPNTLFADSNYVSGEHIKQYRDRGQELMGYPKSYGGKDKAFLLEAFDIDFDNYFSVCPAGYGSIRSSVEKSKNVNIYFDSKTCKQCQFFYPCVREGNKRATRRRLKIGPYTRYTMERRFAAKTAAFREQMKVRAQIEGTISEATRFHGQSGDKDLR